jgi:hypothetical protein
MMPRSLTVEPEPGLRLNHSGWAMYKTIASPSRMIHVFKAYTSSSSACFRHVCFRHHGMNVHVYARWVTVRPAAVAAAAAIPDSDRVGTAAGAPAPGRESLSQSGRARSPRRVGTAAAASRADLKSLNLPAAGPSTPPAVPVIRHTRPRARPGRGRRHRRRTLRSDAPARRSASTVSRPQAAG